MIKMALFDVNNTLFNDFRVWFRAIEETFQVFGKQPLTIREYFEGLKGDYLDLYRKRGITTSREELNKIYESYYENHINEINLFPKVKKTLKFLSQQRIILGFVTPQKNYNVFLLLEKFDLDNFFDYCQCYALNKADTICRILHQERINPQECCFIGDAPSDINHGKKAGVVTIAFLNGNVPEDLVSAAKPDFSIRSFEEIRKIIKEGE